MPKMMFQRALSHFVTYGQILLTKRHSFNRIGSSAAKITFTGYNFASHQMLRCRFCGSIVTSATFVSSSIVNCANLPYITPKIKLFVELSYNDQQFSQSTLNLEVGPPSFSPSMIFNTKSYHIFIATSLLE